jgi:nucleoid-associated protein YgaU
MQKDLKIGLALGLGLAAAAVLWVATRPSMSPEARIRQLHEGDPLRQTGAQREPNDQPMVSVIARSPEPNSAAGQSGTPRPSTPPAEIHAAPVAETPAVRTAVEEQQGMVDSTVHEKTEKIETQRFHIVRKGETLSKISLTYYGSAGKWRKIFEANRETIKNPDKLTAGAKLIIPN